MNDTLSELSEIIQHFQKLPPEDCAFTRGFLPLYQPSEITGSWRKEENQHFEEFFMSLIDMGYEGDMADFFIEF